MPKNHLIQPDAAEPAFLVRAPDWIKDLVLYEIATRGFTSPGGPESGTFDSLVARLPYLADLGVTGIWLTGHSLAHPTHFYGVWTQYAVIQPDRIDPLLGTPDSFHKLIDVAHDVGIKVFLDVITHGVMRDSPLIREHPTWFKGGSWGMTDFDWFGGHTDLDEWWVCMWVNYVTEYGIDGFRLDVATYRPDLWQRIRQAAANAGHPIVIISENCPGWQGVIDFAQRTAIRLSDQRRGLDHASPMLRDAAGYLRRMTEPFGGPYAVRITYVDGSTWIGDDTGSYVQRAGVRETIATGAGGSPTFVYHHILLDLVGVPAKPIEDIVVLDESGQEWHLREWVEMDSRVQVEPLAAGGLRLAFQARYPLGQWLSVQLSSHDNGWDGFPLDQNPYVAQGSRALFGYSLLLAPCIPLFMAGEEFDAEYRPLPEHSPRLFGGELAGRGRWLYASWLDWDQLRQPRHAGMLADVQRLIHLRRAYRGLIRPMRVGDPGGHVLTVPRTAEADVPLPYLYRDDGCALLVAANFHRDRAVQARFDWPLASLGWDTAQRVTVLDVWQETPPRACTAGELAQMVFTLPPDGAPRGGLAVLELRQG